MTDTILPEFEYDPDLRFSEPLQQALHNLAIQYSDAQPEDTDRDMAKLAAEMIACLEAHGVDPWQCEFDDLMDFVYIYPGPDEEYTESFCYYFDTTLLKSLGEDLVADAVNIAQRTSFGLRLNRHVGESLTSLCHLLFAMHLLASRRGRTPEVSVDQLSSALSLRDPLVKQLLVNARRAGLVEFEKPTDSGTPFRFRFCAERTHLYAAGFAYVLDDLGARWDGDHAEFPAEPLGELFPSSQ